MKDGNPNNRQNWKLVCSACAAEFADDETISLLSGHFQEEHADLDGEIHFNTVWIGKGPAPRGNRLNNPGRGRRR